MQKYYNNPNRGTLKPIKSPSGETIKRDPTMMQIPNTKGIWQSNSYTPNIFNKSKPLLGREHTPRGTLRLISLDRNYSKEKWLYNKSQMDELKPEFSKKDLERSKSLKKLSKK